MIHTHEDRGVTVVRIEHGKVGALDLELLGALSATARELAAGAGPVVLTGTGKAFSAGVDLVRLLKEGADYIDPFLDALDAAFLGWFSLPRPVVAAVNGHAIAGGCVLAAACDARWAVEGALLGVPELKVGVPFPGMALAIMEHLLSPSDIQHVLTQGKLYPAEAARELGLVDDLAPADDLLASAHETATALGAIPPEVYALHKRQRRHRSLRRAEDDLAVSEGQVRALWHADATHAQIRRYLDANVGGGKRS